MKLMSKLNIGLGFAWLTTAISAAGIGATWFEAKTLLFFAGLIASFYAVYLIGIEKDQVKK